MRETAYYDVLTSEVVAAAGGGLGGSQLWQIINIRLACGHYNNIRYFIAALFHRAVLPYALSLLHDYLKWTVA